MPRCEAGLFVLGARVVRVPVVAEALEVRVAVREVPLAEAGDDAVLAVEALRS
jgi:hypothetical protein